MKRADLARKVLELAGPDIARLLDPAKGWPSLAEIKTPSRKVRTAMHVGPIGMSHRGRDDIERRFQNPGKGHPVQAPAGFLPLLIGIWVEDGSPILVAMNARSRVGRETRQSLFVPLVVLSQARSARWIEHYSTSGERVVAFSPELLPIYVEMISAGVEVDPAQMDAVLEASGVAGGAADETSLDRGRRAASQLIRDALFSKRVRESYGCRCTMSMHHVWLELLPSGRSPHLSSGGTRIH